MVEGAGALVAAGGAGGAAGFVEAGAGIVVAVAWGARMGVDVGFGVRVAVGSGVDVGEGVSVGTGIAVAADVGGGGFFAVSWQATNTMPVNTTETAKSTFLGDMLTQLLCQSGQNRPEEQNPSQRLYTRSARPQGGPLLPP